MPKPKQYGSILVAWLLVSSLLVIGSATIGNGPGTIYYGQGQVMTSDMTDKPAYYWDAPAKVRFGPFARYTGGPQTFGMDWSSPPGLVNVQISGCYDLATIVLNGKIIFNSVGGQGNRGDSVEGLVKYYNHMTLTLQGGCLAANAYITIQPVVQLCPECGDMAGKDITIVGGYYTGYYYDIPADHPDMGIGPIDGDTPYDHDWWDDKYFSYKQLDEIPQTGSWCNPGFGPGWFPTGWGDDGCEGGDCPPGRTDHWEECDDCEGDCADGADCNEGCVCVDGECSGDCGNPCADNGDCASGCACDDGTCVEADCYYAVQWKQKFYAPLDDTYQFEVSPYGDSWVYIDGELVFDSDWGTNYGEVTLTKGFHDIRIFHAYRGPCDDCTSQFNFGFAPNIHADAEDTDYFNVDIWGDDEWEDECFLNIW